jgi:hypothetical protein
MKSGIRVTKKLFPLIVLGVILLSCFGLVLACPYLFRPRSFRVSDLEIPSNIFPDDVSVNHVYPLSDEFGTIDNGSQSIYWHAGNAGYTIYRYPTTWQAMVEFNRTKHLFFSGAEDVWPSIADSILSSTTADAIYIACGNQTISYQECGMVARYQEYVVAFSAIMDDKMTDANFEKIVVYIDEQISSRLHP